MADSTAHLHNVGLLVSDTADTEAPGATCHHPAASALI
jgi:hypothetical protein